jgi:hypothetical protein
LRPVIERKRPFCREQSVLDASQGHSGGRSIRLVLPMDIDHLLAIIVRTIGAARGRAARGSPG